MPITGPSSYIPTMNEFIFHWELVNDELGISNQLVVAGGASSSTLITLRTNLIAKRAELEGYLNDVQIDSATIKGLKAQLLTRFGQFAGQVRGLFAGQPFEAALTDQPGFSDNESKFIKGFNDISSLWEDITDAGTTITLVGDYDRTQLDADVETLRAAYVSYNNDEAKARLCRVQRNKLQDDTRPILKNYRQMVPARLGEDAPLAETLPRYSPKPGATPDAVNASAIWDAAEAKASLAWEASDNPNLKEYQVRYTPGPDYDNDDENVVATLLPDAPRELLTDAGLTQPGAESTFKVYVVLTTGNEKGSTALTVERPLE